MRVPSTPADDDLAFATDLRLIRELERRHYHVVPEFRVHKLTVSYAFDERFLVHYAAERQAFREACDRTLAHRLADKLLVDMPWRRYERSNADFTNSITFELQVITPPKRETL